MEDAKLSGPQSKNKRVKPLGGADLALVSAGETGEGTDIKDDVKPGDTKRLIAVYGTPVPRKRVSAEKTAGPAKNQKKSAEKAVDPVQHKKQSADKSVSRPASPGRKKRPERSLS
jgi:hypothetical protein